MHFDVGWVMQTRLETGQLARSWLSRKCAWSVRETVQGPHIASLQPFIVNRLQ